MAAMVWVLLVLAGCAGYVGRRLYSYPGGWAYAFGGAYARDRQDLAAARRRLRGLEREARRELSDARSHVRGEESRHRERIRTAEQHLRELRHPGRGELLESLGELKLHQHQLRFGTRDIQLAGLHISYEQASGEFAIQIRGGLRVSYQRGQYTEADVRRFAGRIEDAVTQENDFRKQRRSLIAQAEAELRRVRADTAPKDSARAQLVQLTERQRQDRRLVAARAELEAACERWYGTSGHRPAA
ncbi:hypothetical protein [Actinacidiphila soli]|uniref:hypothetical protein n=1 Tax=Actinacidiphila soli TaxID=2487275 RepID=UPI000FCB5721|nr:hypothetical protein [Actinacidiphila soli]